MGKRCQCKSSSVALLKSSEEIPDPNNPIRILKEVKDHISDIYLEHRLDLEQRKRKRLDSKNPTDYFQPYNLVINTQFQVKIREQIQSTIKVSLGELLKESVITLMNEFIEYLSGIVKKFDDKKALLQAVMIYEAYHTLLNSISQVGGIISELISKYAFEVINKKCFYEKIILPYLDLLTEISKNKNCRYIEELNRMKNEVKTLENIYNETAQTENNSTLYSDSCSESEETEALHNLPIDDLVKFLNGSENKKKKKGKIDKEIEKFFLALDSVEVKEKREKPRVSQEFLVALREKLNKIKSN